MVATLKPIQILGVAIVGLLNGEVTEKGLCSFIRHNYTNYEEILAGVRGKVGASDLYVNVKVYLCCRIIAHYELDVNPLHAAFGEWLPYNEIVTRFIDRYDTGLDRAD